MFFVTSPLFTRRFLPRSNYVQRLQKNYSKLVVLFVLGVFFQNCLFSFGKWLITCIFEGQKRFSTKITCMYFCLHVLNIFTDFQHLKSKWKPALWELPVCAAVRLASFSNSWGSVLPPSAQHPGRGPVKQRQQRRRYVAGPPAPWRPCDWSP